VSDVADASNGPPESLSDYRAFRRPYRWLLLYGPWALAILGVALIGVGLFANRPSEVALAAIGFGAAMFIAAVLLPRMRGPVDIGASGVKGALEGLPPDLMYVAGAKRAAEHAIPADAPDRDRRVDEVVGRTARELTVALWDTAESLRDTAQTSDSLPPLSQLSQLFDEVIGIRKPAKKANQEDG
jgi:hypothetical protein